eukprot:scaffold896_cov58-Attheya_sp.AAC.5
MRRRQPEVPTMKGQPPSLPSPHHLMIVLIPGLSSANHRQYARLQEKSQQRLYVKTTFSSSCVPRRRKIKRKKVTNKIAKSIVTHLKGDEHVQSQPEALKRYIETSALQLNTAVRSKFQNKYFVPTSACIKTPMKYSSNLKDDTSMSELVMEFEKIKEEFKKKATEVFRKANEIEIENIFLKIGEIMAKYTKNRNKTGIYSTHISDTIVAARAFYAGMDEVPSFKQKLLSYLEIQEDKLFVEIKEQIPGTDLSTRGQTEDDKSLAKK